MDKSDYDFLWTFCGLSVDYILNVCCLETLGNVLREKYPQMCGDFRSDGFYTVYLKKNTQAAPSLSPSVFGYLRKKAVKEFYSLLALDNLTYRRQLQKEIFDYMYEGNRNTLNLWGYFDFRLSRYYDLIERAVHNTLNRYSETRDYEKCLKMIGEITVNREHRLKVLHIVFLPGGGFLLLNENGEIMENAEINHEMTAAINLGLKLDDILSAVFIYYAPLEIVVHNNGFAVNTVSPMVWDMAGAEVCFCGGCGVCVKYGGKLFAEV